MALAAIRWHCLSVGGDQSGELVPDSWHAGGDIIRFGNATG